MGVADQKRHKKANNFVINCCNFLADLFVLFNRKSILKIVYAKYE